MIGSGRLLSLMLALSLAGCASMSEKECLSANWLDRGYRDGRNGEPASRIEDHREACAGVGVMPDRAAYTTGREKGILEYCTPANALEQGRLGRPYRNACPAQLEAAFLERHRLGYRAYEAQQRVETLGRQSVQLERALSREKNESARGRLREELRRLDRRLAQARDDLRYAESSVQAVAAW